MAEVNSSWTLSSFLDDLLEVFLDPVLDSTLAFTVLVAVSDGFADPHDGSSGVFVGSALFASVALSPGSDSSHALHESSSASSVLHASRFPGGSALSPGSGSSHALNESSSASSVLHASSFPGGVLRLSTGLSGRSAFLVSVALSPGSDSSSVGGSSLSVSRDSSASHDHGSSSSHEFSSASSVLHASLHPGGSSSGDVTGSSGGLADSHLLLANESKFGFATQIVPLAVPAPVHDNAVFTLAPVVGLSSSPVGVFSFRSVDRFSGSPSESFLFTDIVEADPEFGVACLFEEVLLLSLGVDRDDVTTPLFASAPC